MMRTVSGLILATDYDALFAEIAELVRVHVQGVVKALLFGSLARREAEASSDVDILLVWPAHDDEDSYWDAAMDMAHHVDVMTNRTCLPLIYTEDEYRRISQRHPELVESINRDAVDLLKL